MYLNLTKNKKQKGQALLFVVVAVTIALSVGVSISTRTLSSQRRVSTSDSATRVANAAEGGAEWALGQTYSTLSTLSSGTSITYSPTSGDNISTKATITAIPFSLNSSDNYWFDLSPGMVKEVRLVGFTGTKVHVCWENQNTAIYTLSYNSDGDITKDWSIGTGFSNPSNISGFTGVGTWGGYQACALVTPVSTPYGLRIKALFESTRVHVYPIGDTLPEQGYKITSIGEIVSGGSSDIKEKRIVVVYKSFPYAPSFIDTALYSSTGSIN